MEHAHDIVAVSEDDAIEHEIELEANRRKLRDLRQVLESIGTNQHYTRKHVIMCLKRLMTRDYRNVPEDERIVDDNLPGHEVPLKILESVLPPFTGDSVINIKQWLINFEDIATMCKWVDMQKVMYCKMLLRGSAQLFVSTEKCGVTFEDLKEALTDEFEDLSNSNVVRNVLAKRSKKPDETLREYFYKMCHMGVQGNVKATDVIRFIVNGIDGKDANKAVLKQAKSLPELKRKLSRFQTKRDGSETKRQMRRLEAGTSRQDNYEYIDCSTLMPISRSMPEFIYCAKCNGLGHTFQTCYKEQD